MTSPTTRMRAAGKRSMAAAAASGQRLVGMGSSAPQKARISGPEWGMHNEARIVDPSLTSGCDLAALLDEHVAAVQRSRRLLPEVERLTEICVAALRRGNKILLCGNGGSAADCQHIATELTVRFERERGALPAGRRADRRLDLGQFAQCARSAPRGAPPGRYGRLPHGTRRRRGPRA